MPKSPEALQIFFSGPGAARALREYRLTPAQRRTIEEAMASARGLTPDLDLLHRADLILQAAPRIEEESPPSSPALSDTGESLRDLSGYFPHDDSRKHRPFWKAPRRGLLDYLIWRHRWRNLYAPLISLAIMLIIYLLFMLFPSLGWRTVSSGFLDMNTARYAEARKICRDLDQKLPATPEDLLRHLDKLNDSQSALGYWLRDGRIYIPKDHSTLPGDKRLHWYICVEE